MRDDFARDVFFCVGSAPVRRPSAKNTVIPRYAIATITRPGFAESSTPKHAKAAKARETGIIAPSWSLSHKLRPTLFDVSSEFRNSAVHPCRMLRHRFCYVIARIRRTQTNISWHRHPNSGSRVHAVACEGETAAVSSNRQCGVEGGRRTVGAVCLPLADRLDGFGDQRDLAHQVGRPDCRFSGSAAYPSGRLGSLAREDLRLLKANAVDVPFCRPT
jgi:hypothetical protein